MLLSPPVCQKVPQCLAHTSLRMVGAHSVSPRPKRALRGSPFDLTEVQFGEGWRREKGRGVEEEEGEGEG